MPGEEWQPRWERNNFVPVEGDKRRDWGVACAYKNQPHRLWQRRL